IGNFWFGIEVFGTVKQSTYCCLFIFCQSELSRELRTAGHLVETVADHKMGFVIENIPFDQFSRKIGITVKLWNHHIHPALSSPFANIGIHCIEVIAEIGSGGNRKYYL